MKRDRKASSSGRQAAASPRCSINGTFRMWVRGGGNGEFAAQPASRAAWMLAAVIITTLLFLPSIAAAAPPVNFVTPGQGAGQAESVRSVAVDSSSGDVYITDNNTIRTSRFDSEGNFLLAWGYGVANPQDPYTWQVCGPAADPPTTSCYTGTAGQDIGPGSGRPQSVAVDPLSGDVYIRESSRIEKFTPSGEFLLMFGKNVDTTPGTLHPNTCTAADVTAGDTCTWGEAGTEPGAIESGGVAMVVDASGALWVAGTERIEKFNSDGTFDSQIELPGAGQIESFAFDSSGNLYVKSREFLGVRKLEAGSWTLIETLDAAGEPVTLTLDGADNVYIGDQTDPYRFMVFNPAGEQVAQFGAGQVIGTPGYGFGGTNGIAVGDTADVLYSASGGTGTSAYAQMFFIPEPGPLVVQQGTQDILPTAATLTGKLNPEYYATTYFFEYGTDENYGHSTPVTALPATGFEEEQVSAEIEHLIPSTTYHFRLVATNHCNVAEPAEECTNYGEDETFETQPALQITSERATEVTSTSTLIKGNINPLGVAGTWWLEYGTTPAYGATSPVGTLGATFGEVPVEVGLHELTPSTTYFYRFVAQDERDGVVYIVHGQGRSFTTQGTSIDFLLPDSRVWEMVSPADKHGAKLVGSHDGLIQAAADGDGLAYLSVGSIEENPEGSRIAEPALNLGHRGEGGVWASKDITPPNQQASPLGAGLLGEYKLFTADLQQAVLEARSGTPLSPEASERTPYLRQNTEPGVYRPLVTGKEGYANVPPGTQFGGDPQKESVLPVQVAGATPDLQHIALKSSAPLVAGAPAALPSLFEWTDGQISPISVLPAGEGQTENEIVSTWYIGSGPGSLKNAISADGSRVFWSLGSSGAGLSALYMRDMGAGKTIRLDVPEELASGGGESSPRFDGASSDGSVVFFTDSRQLTPDASPEGRDLYRCELPLETDLSRCATLTDLSAGEQGSTESGEVQGLAFGLTDDGAKAYFAAKGVLDDSPNQFGDTATPGRPNLYLWQQGEGLRFIATLASHDSPDWGLGPPRSSPEGGGQSTAMSPSGRYLAFMSERSLTGQANLDEATGEPTQEVFQYDSGSDRLACVSCNPSGADAQGRNTGIARLVDPREMWTQSNVAALLPEATQYELGGLTLYRPRVVLDSGRMFFNAVDPLVPADSNGDWDVYQYEPVGVGDCEASSGSASISYVGDSCIALVSSGTGEEEAGFLDASVSGDDVFFLAPTQLSVVDEDHELDVYDARVGGIAAKREPITECLGEACQPANEPPNDPTPASSAFRGHGNVPPKAHKRCGKNERKVRRKGKVRCVRARSHGSHGHRKHHHKQGRMQPGPIQNTRSSWR